MLHRGAKAVTYRLKQQNVECNEKEVAEAIKNCSVCKAYNPKRTKGFKFIAAFERGENLGFDIMGPLKGEYIITAIDYFTCEGFAKRIVNRESKHVLKFLQEVNNELKIKILISDGAKENCDKVLKEWMQAEGIKHHKTSAHHHESNGRIERFNKTILDGLRKGCLKGLLQVRLNHILEQYHNTYHEGLGMTPYEAKNIQNWDKIKSKTLDDIVSRYQSKFKLGNWEKLALNEEVLIRTEIGREKTDPLFKEIGTIVEVWKMIHITLKG
jgi:hypothetical protein